MAKKTNIVINGKEYYRVTRTVGHKADGSPIRKTFYGSGKNEAEAKADEYIANLEKGLISNYEYIILNDLIYKWLFQIKKNEVKPASFQSYEGTYRNYIKDSEIAGLKLYNIKSMHIQEYYNKLGKTKTFSQIKKLNKLLSERTGQPLDVINRDTERDNYMTAQEALEYGLIDGIMEKRP